MGNNLTNCVFTGVKFDEKATDAVIHIANAIEKNAEACESNAKALNQLSYIFSASQVQFESFVKINGECLDIPITNNEDKETK